MFARVVSFGLAFLRMSAMSLLPFPAWPVSSTLTRLIAGVVMTAALAACGGGAKYEPPPIQNPKEDIYRYGSILGGDGGIQLFGPKKRSEEEQSGSAIGVNSYLWRAALDTVAFMPVVSADPFGGVILTDWYSPPETPGERTKVNIYILDRQLRADGVRVTVFRQVRERDSWRDAASPAEVATKMEDIILTRARQLRVAQKEKG
jgi:hypothetical protein